MKNWLETIVILVIVSSALLAVVGKKSFAGPMRVVCALSVACAALALPVRFVLSQVHNAGDPFINFDYGGRSPGAQTNAYPGEDMVDYAAARLLEARLEEILESAVGKKLEVRVTGEKSVRVRLEDGIEESEVRLVLSVLGAGWDITAEECG
ncbi:MAG: hypothetical protein IJV00_07450 [Clostridia bacterium]|nr:hypothetical protein [Clostridia bacterium]